MADSKARRSDRCFAVGLWGSVIAAICCFTPVLVIALGLLGLAVWTPYLDAVLLPMLALFLLLAGFGWWQKRRRIS